MKSWEKWSINLLTAILTVTGLVYLWMKYFLVIDDPFSVVNHPLQPLMLDLHILFAPLFLFMFGYLIQSHILKKLKGQVKPNRKTGIISLFSLPLMVLSGYALQVLVDPLLLKITLVLHVASGIVFSLVYFAHLLISVRLWRRQARRVSSQARVAA